MSTLVTGLATIGRLLVLTLLLIPALPLGTTPRSRPPAQFTGATWVGLADDEATAVAVLVGETVVRAYLCDDREVNAWLLGTVDGEGSRPRRAPR